MPSLLRPGPALALAFLFLHVTVWTVYAAITNTGALHRDMIEAYSWGREFQLGYYKHPPFWAWVAGAWFQVFPRTNWAFYLLANLNAGIAIIGVWQLAGLFTRGIHRLNATLLILLIPFYTIQGHQYNANFIQVSLWPWTVYFFLLSMEKQRLRDSILFGALATAGLLSKYYGALLLLTCFIASFFHPRWRQYYRSPLPYISVAVCALLFGPHFWWLVNNGFAPFKYAEEKTAYPAATIFVSIFAFILGCIAFNLLGAALTLFSRRSSGESGEAACAPVSRDYERVLAVLALAPFLLTLLSAAAGHLRLSTNFASPIFFLVPLLLIQTLKPSPELLRRRATWAVALLYAGALLGAPAIPSVLAKFKQQESRHILEVAQEAKHIWSEITGRPLRVAAGYETYAMGTSFYSGEDTSAFLSFDLSRSPWIKPAALAETGFLGICDEADETCQKRAAELGGPGMRGAHILFAGDALKPVNLRLFISPPRRQGASADGGPDVAAK